MKNIFRFMLCLTIIGCVFSFGCSNKGEIGSKSNPIKFYFMPLKDKDIADKNIEILKNYIEQNTGFYVKTVGAKDYLEIIKAFGKNKADVAFMNTLGYLLAHDWAGAEAGLTSLYGDSYETYQGEILVRSDSGISSLNDLNGKIIAFADPYSASGYLYPLKLIKENNVAPAEMIFAKGHIDAIGMLYDGTVDAIATYHTKPGAGGVERDARAELVKQHPDVMSSIKILALTEEIPNGAVVFGKEFPEIMKSKISEVLMTFSKTDEGKKAIGDLYNITGFIVGKNEDYDAVRETLKKSSKTIQDMIPGGEPYFKAYIVPGLE